MPLPEVYLQPEQQGEILLANTMEKGNLIPSFVVRANLLQGRPEREIAFVATRKLAFMRSEHYLKLALPTNTELKTALLSAIMLVQPKFPIPQDARALVAQYLPVLQRKVTPNIREQLAAVVNRFLQQAGTIDMARWGNGVDLTTQRVGFIICGDLSVAAKMVSMEPVTLYAAGSPNGPFQLLAYRVPCGTRVPGGGGQRRYCDFDLGAAEVQEARYFKVEDGELFPCPGGTTSEGADIDAVEILHLK